MSEVKELDTEDIFGDKEKEETIVLEECYQSTGGWGSCANRYKKKDVVKLRMDNVYNYDLYLHNQGGETQLWRNKR